MIDTHCHILPHLDDGPSSWEECLAMAQRAAEDGITKIIATPHTKNGVYENKGDQIMEKVSHLNWLLEKNKIHVKIFPGCEIQLYDRILDDLEQEDQNGLISLNYSSRLLIELPSNIKISPEIENCIFKIQLKGFIPVIAHVERVYDFYYNLDILERWVEQGIETQLTSASLNGIMGKKAHLFALRLLQRGLITYLVSDAHSDSKFGRKPILSEGVKKITKVIGSQKALDLVTTNPEKIMSNRED